MSITETTVKETHTMQRTESPTADTSTAPKSNGDTPNDTPKQRNNNGSKSGKFRKETVTLSQLVTAVAEKRRIDTTRAGKLIRSRIRARHDDLRTGKNGAPKWNALKDKSRADGNRYPAMPATVANYLFDTMTKRGA